MTQVPPESETTIQTVLDASNSKPLTPLRCVLGAAIASLMSIALYSMTRAIATSFALHKIQSSNVAVLKISAAVRTLVIGMAALGTFVFGFAALGLTALAIQLIIQRFFPKPTIPSTSSNPSTKKAAD